MFSLFKKKKHHKIKRNHLFSAVMNSRTWIMVFLLTIFLGMGLFGLIKWKNDPLPPPPENVVLPTVSLPIADANFEAEKEAAIRQLEQEKLKEEQELLILREASEKQDISICEDITISSLREQCIGDVTIALVAKSGKREGCSYLSGSYRSACEDEVYFTQSIHLSSSGSIEERKELCAKIQDHAREEDCLNIMEKSVLSLQRSGSDGLPKEKYCEELSSTGTRSACYEVREDLVRNQVATTASVSSDSLACDRLQDTLLIASCKDGVFYTQARKNSQPATCEKIIDSTLRDQCTQEILLFQDQDTYKNARTTTDLSLCGAIQ
jgi:hypothetical protein